MFFKANSKKRRLNLYFFGLFQGIVYFIAGRSIKGFARLLCPIHYTRYKELPIALRMLEPKSGERILDISSPKILSVYCSYRLNVQVVTTDILASALEEAYFFKKKLLLANLEVGKEDARNLSFPDNYFDKIVSVSVFEHIAPASKGEITAVREAARVLKPGGVMVLTLAFAREYYEEFKNGSVYERDAHQHEKIFFQRFYDEEALNNNIILPSGMEVIEKTYIIERIKSFSPGSTLAFYVNSGRMQNMIFGPVQPMLSAIFLKERSSLNKSEKPIIVCLKLRKKS